MMVKSTRIFGVAAFAALTLLAALPADAVDKNDWILRGRFVHVNAQDTGDALPGFAGGHVGTESSNAFELDVVYAVTPRFNLELSLFDSGHDLEGRGSLDSLGDVADFRMLPVTLTGQWRILPNKFASPYVGGGVTYVNIHDVDSKVSLVEGVAEPTDITMEDEWGWTLQAGIDLFFSERWSMNVDLKYTDVEIDTSFETGGIISSADNHIDPWVSGIGVGFRF